MTVGQIVAICVSILALATTMYFLYVRPRRTFLSMVAHDFTFFQSSSALATWLIPVMDDLKVMHPEKAEMFELTCEELKEAKRKGDAMSQLAYSTFHKWSGKKGITPGAFENYMRKMDKLQMRITLDSSTAQRDSMSKWWSNGS